MIKIILEKIEGDKAILKFSDGQKISLPKKELPENLLPGDSLVLTLLDINSFTKKILEEIINS